MTSNEPHRPCPPENPAPNPVDGHPPGVLAPDGLVDTDRRPLRRLAQLDPDLAHRQADRPDRITRRVDRHSPERLDPLPQGQAQGLQGGDRKT